jgi:serine/threonine protein kinase
MKATFEPKDRLGPYELLLKLGSGGMATVILARHRGAADFERLVVVKRVHRRHLANKDFLTMFRDEARLASSIRHPNVASVIDLIETGGELCLVMEYFEGISVAGMIQAQVVAEERMAPAVASRILSDSLAGLHAAHEAVDIRRSRLGIIHRDVSPQNLLVDVEGVSRVLDFGIAKAESRLTQTKSGFVKGKLGYMSPEQIEAAPLDRRSDLYSAGIVLYELLTGRRLFSSDDEFETIRRVLRGEIPDISSGAPWLPRELDGVIRKALARSPADRYSTGLELQQAIAQVVPPAPPHEVGALVSRLGAESLQRIRGELADMLGFDVARASRGPTTVGGPPGGVVSPRSTRGKTVPMLIAPRVGPPSRDARKLVLVATDEDGRSEPPEPPPGVHDDDVGEIAGVPSRRANGWMLALALGVIVATLIVAYQAFSMPYFRR